MDFLFELGLEEVPARMLADAQADLQRRVVALLEREYLLGGASTAQSYSTPRRLAVIVTDVLPKAPDVDVDSTGPAMKIAFKDGVATPAAEAFAHRCGLTVAELTTVSTPKGEYLSARISRGGRPAAEVIAAELPKELSGIYWAKNMYWRTGRPERFVRPVRWLLALLGQSVVPVEFAGYTAANVTFGHRVLFGAAEIVVGSPSEYEEKLAAAFVMANVEARRHTIRKALDRVCRTMPELRWREDHVLVDKMTHLTEWPSVIAGGFEPEYLALPEEVLVTVMRDHQSYFAVEDKQGKLAPHFLAVLNMQADAEGEAVIRHGNARVLRARFNDARFFWEFDQRVPLVERVKLLENVTFQKDLGSYAAKTERVRVLAETLANWTSATGTTVDFGALDEAARFAKADLTTELVKEFTELQGEVGGLYGCTQGLSKKACDAIYDHYRPESMEERIPSTTEGQLLATADKADTIAGMFSLGLEPTGSKDPFALRRAANGIVKIQAEGAIEIDLEELTSVMARRDPTLQNRLIIFFVERVEFYLRDVHDLAYDVVKAVMSSGTGIGGPLESVRDLIKRGEAISAVRGSADFAAVAAAFKRMKNILTQAQEKGIAAAGVLSTALLTEAAETTLAARSAELAVRVAELREQREYVTALEQIATLRSQVDAFFDAVMVMDPDPGLRANRLALLTRVLQDFSGIADFSQLVTQGPTS